MNETLQNKQSKTQDKVIALIPVPAGLVDDHALAQTLIRLSRCQHLASIVLVGNTTDIRPNCPDWPEGVQVIQCEKAQSDDANSPAKFINIDAGRAWSNTCWRGGIAGMTIYDELLYTNGFTAECFVEALDHYNAGAALLVGADWSLIDSSLCDQVIERYMQSPGHHPMVFTQAVPGLCGLLLAAPLLQQLNENHATIGQLLDYNPIRPQADPIAHHQCVQLPAQLKPADLRFTSNMPRWKKLIDAVYEAKLQDDSVAALALAHQLIQAKGHDLPQQITLEITTRRQSKGPLVPVSQINLNRRDLSPNQASNWFDQLATIDDLALTLGGLGDALCHEQWFELVQLARQAGIKTIAIETDLLVEQDVLDQLLETVDVIKVHLNADTAPTYQKLMGHDSFDRVLGNIETLINTQRKRGDVYRTWIVPTLAKCHDNVAELESFVDRWMYYTQTVLVTGPVSGCGLIEDHAVIDMSPPKRIACRQLNSRMTILSDGTIPSCDQDWLARQPVGNINDQALKEVWQAINAIRLQHENNEYSELCENCNQWHRP